MTNSIRETLEARIEKLRAALTTLSKAEAANYADFAKHALLNDDARAETDKAVHAAKVASLDAGVEGCRSEFEKWYSKGKADCPSIEKTGNNYDLMQAHQAWIAWQAAWQTKSAVVEALR